MTELLVPISLDCLVLRADTAAADWALTALDEPRPRSRGRRRQQLVPDPFQPLDQARPRGVHLHWALPDGLTHGRFAGDTDGAAAFPAAPDRWLVVRIATGATPGVRDVAAWLLPDAGARTAVRLDDALSGPALPAPGPAPTEPLTALGPGDLGWAGYYDNVTNRFALHDAAADVSGSLAYLVVGWHTDATRDPVAVASETDFHDRMEQLDWALTAPLPSGTPFPTRTVYHAAALSIGWPDAHWPGDAGLLGTELDLRPDPDAVQLAVGETLAEATAALDATDPGAIRLVEGLLAGALHDAAGPSGPAALDIQLHVSRFGSRPAPADSEYIWQPADPQTTLASTDPSNVPGSFVEVSRSRPRLWHALDPTLVVRGGGRSPKHGGDGRYDPLGYLRCRIVGETVNAFGVSGGDPGTGADVLPATPLAGLPAEYGVPAAATDLLVELAALDPGSAPDLAAATATDPSPVAAARAAWWASFDPAVPAESTLTGASVVGTLPSPVGMTPPTRPWAPLHLEWRASYRPSPRGAHDWVLGDVDYQLPDAVTVPPADPAHPLQGRVLLSAAPALALDGAAGPTGTGRPGGGDAGLAAQDLLSGELSAVAEQLRGDDLGAVVDGITGSGSGDLPPGPRPSGFVALRAGFLEPQALRLVDGFGQVVELMTAAGGRTVLYGSTLAVPGADGVAALRPRFTAPAQVLLRFADATGALRDADGGASPVCGYVVPSMVDATLEFFDSNGTGYGRLRPDPVRGTAWEEDPGRAATLGSAPSAALPNPFVGAIADRLLAADVAAAVGGGSPGSVDAAGGLVGTTALSSLLRVLDTTRWTVDLGGRSGDEHLSLLLGNPIAVVRAYLLIEVHDPRKPAENETTSVAVKLGTLGHLDDGLLGYVVADDYDRLMVVDPAVAQLAPGLPTGSGPSSPPGADPLTNPYVDTSGVFYVNPGVPVTLTMLMTPGSDVHVTVGLLPQKAVGMVREWTAPALSRLSPALRRGPVLRDATTTRLPLPADIRAVWTWHRRPSPSEWAQDTVVASTVDATLPDEPALVSDGWLQATLLPDNEYPQEAIPVRVTSVRSTGKPGRSRQILALGGENADESQFLVAVQDAILLIDSGRFAFYVEEEPFPRVWLRIVRPRGGSPYLRSTADARSPNNLDNLPEAPVSAP